MNERIKGEMNELKDLKMTGVYIIPIFLSINGAAGKFSLDFR